MNCKKCNAELLEGSSFCPYCGEKNDELVSEVVETKDNLNTNQNTEAPCWAKFAKIANILGIITICTFWIPLFGILATETGTVGIIFGALGKRTKKQEAKELAESGFKKSLIGTILSCVVFTIFYAIFYIVLLEYFYMY